MDTMISNLRNFLHADFVQSWWSGHDDNSVFESKPRDSPYNGDHTGWDSILWLEADESMQTGTRQWAESLRALADNVIGGRVAHTDQAVIVSADGTLDETKAVLWLKYYQIYALTKST